jgi:YjbE family integral membrane protein
MDFLGSEIGALISVVIIDLVLAGDNAIVVGIAAAGLPSEQRRKVIVIGIAAAAGLRIVFALMTTQLLGIIGLTLAGGLLLLWVVWKLWREVRSGFDEAGTSDVEGEGQTKTFSQAMLQIVVADVSMSLDNVLAVAGTARDHLWVLVVGLVLSVALMGAAAAMIARLLKRLPWISYVGLILIAWVAATMIYDGGWEVFTFADQAGMI